VVGAEFLFEELRECITEQELHNPSNSKLLAVRTETLDTGGLWVPRQCRKACRFSSKVKQESQLSFPHCIETIQGKENSN
jgi:hypothetical protein